METQNALSKQDFLLKNKAKFDKSGLSKQERGRRYQQYLQSRAMRKAPGQRPIRKRPIAGQQSYMSLSDASKSYAYALVNPWHETRLPPSVPDLVTIPSYKFSVFSRGTFTAGTGGAAFVAFDPYVCWYDAAGDDFPIVTTNSAYASADVFNISSSTSGLTRSGITSPFSGHDFIETSERPATKEFRTVAAGIKCRYVGPEISRGGRLIEYRSPVNSQIFTQTFTTMLQNRETESAPVDREWRYCVWRPCTQWDTMYYAYSSPADYAASKCLALFVVGATAGVAFEYEAIAHFEVVGTGLPATTSTISDPVGMAAISNALPSHQPDGSPESNWSRFLPLVLSAGAQYVSGIPLSSVGASLASSVMQMQTRDL